MASVAENKTAKPAPEEPACAWAAWVLSSVSVGLIFLPLILSLSKGGDSIAMDKIIRYEKRVATIWPAKPINALTLEAYPKAVESYVNDHFALRNTLVKLHHGLKYRLDISPSQDAEIGRDGWLFFSHSNEWDDVRGIATLSFIEKVRWCLYLNRVHDALSKQGIPFLFVLAPDKSSIYPEYLPGNVQGARDKHRLDDLLAFLKLNHCRANILDLRGALRSQKEQGRLYHKQDSHWNFLGAAFGAREILLKLSTLGAHVEPNSVTMTTFDPEPTTDGDLLKFMNQQGEEVAPVWKPHLKSEYDIDYDWADLAALYPSSQAESKFRFVTRSSKGQEHLLIFRDSFSTNMTPCLSPQFEWAAYVWTHPSETEVTNAVYKLKPTVVVWETVERDIAWLVAQGPDYDSPAAHFDFLPKKIFEWSEMWRNSVSATTDVANLLMTNNGISVVAADEARPRIFLNKLPNFDRGTKILRCQVISPGISTFTIRGESSETGESERFSLKAPLQAGSNDVALALPEKSLKGMLRIQLGDFGGKYEINKLVIRSENPEIAR